MWPMMSSVWTFCSSWIGGQTCKLHLHLFSHFREDFWSLKKNQKIIMVAKSPLWWRHHFFFLSTILSQLDPQFFSYWSHVALYVCNYDVIKYRLFTMRSPSYVPGFNFSPRCGFRDRGPKFFRFSSMAATPHDLWRHNYDLNIPHD